MDSSTIEDDDGEVKIVAEVKAKGEETKKRALPGGGQKRERSKGGRSKSPDRKRGRDAPGRGGAAKISIFSSIIALSYSMLQLVHIILQGVCTAQKGGAKSCLTNCGFSLSLLDVPPQTELVAVFELHVQCPEMLSPTAVGIVF